MKQSKNYYVTPLVTLVHLHTVDMLCESPWYLKRGEGDFNYNVEEDNEFA